MELQAFVQKLALKEVLAQLEKKLDEKLMMFPIKKSALQQKLVMIHSLDSVQFQAED